MTFQQLVNIIHYGISFQSDFRDDSHTDYLNGVIESTAFIASCIIVQDFGLEEGIGEQDILEALGLDKFPNKNTIEKGLRRLFKKLNIDTREN